MIKESGRVVSIESDSLWVETVQQSSCNGCSAKPGCGQGLLAKFGLKTSYIRVLLQGRDNNSFVIGSEVEFGVHENIVAVGSLVVYLLPLLGLVVGALVGEQLSATGSELVSSLGGILGFLLGAALVRWHAYKTRNDPRLQPVLIDGLQPISVN